MAKPGSVNLDTGLSYSDVDDAWFFFTTYSSGTVPDPLNADIGSGTIIPILYSGGTQGDSIYTVSSPDNTAFDTTSTQGLEWTPTTGYSYGGAFSIALTWSNVGSATTLVQTAFGLGLDVTNTGSDIRIRLDKFTGGGAGLANVYVPYPSTTSFDTLVIVVDWAGGTLDVYDSTTSYSDTFTPPASGAMDYDYLAYDGSVDYQLAAFQCWNRALTSTEANAIVADPYDLIDGASSGSVLPLLLSQYRRHR